MTFESPTASPVSIAQKMENNFIGYSRLRDGINGGIVIETSSIAQTRSAMKSAGGNRVYRITADNDNEIRQIVHATIDEYKQANCAMLWHVGELTTKPSSVIAALEDEGLKKTESFCGMTLSNKKHHGGELAPELRVEVVEKQQQIDDWLIPFVDAFHIEDAVKNHFGKCMSELIGKNRNECWLVGYVGEKPVAAGGYLIDSGVTMLYSICTLTSFRRRGFGRKITESAISMALERQESPICLYTTDPISFSMYEEIGFTKIYELETFLFEPHQS